MFQKLIAKLNLTNLQKNSALYSIVTKNGYSVRSMAEKIIDDYLYDNGIEYYYEDHIIIMNPTNDWQEYIYDRIKNSKIQKLKKFRNYKFDWVIICRDSTNHKIFKVIFLEYFGRKDKKYIANSHKKRELYNKLGLKLIELYPTDLKNIHEILRTKFINDWESIKLQNQTFNESHQFEFNTLSNRVIKQIIKQSSTQYLEDLQDAIQKELSLRTGSLLVKIPITGKFKDNIFYEDKSSSGIHFKSYRDPQVKIILFNPELEGGKFFHIYLKPKKVFSPDGIKYQFSVILYDQTIIGVRAKAKLQKEEDYSQSYEYFEVDLSQTSDSSSHIKYLRKLYSAGQAYAISKERSNLFYIYQVDQNYGGFFK